MTDDKVVKLHTAKNSKDPDQMLEMAKGDFKSVCVIGVNQDGNIEGRATKDMSVAELLFYLESIKLTIMMHGRYEEGDDDE